MGWEVRISPGLHSRLTVSFCSLVGQSVPLRDPDALGGPLHLQRPRDHASPPPLGLSFSSQGKAKPPGCLCSHPISAHRCCCNKKHLPLVALETRGPRSGGHPNSSEGQREQWDSDESPPPGCRWRLSCCVLQGRERRSQVPGDSEGHPSMRTGPS